MRLPVKDVVVLNKELLNNGMKFMILELSSSFLQNSATIAAASFLGLGIAGEYNLIMKLFTFFVSIFQSIFNPLWGAFSKALYSSDFNWCKRIYCISIKYIYIFLSIFILILMALGNTFLNLLFGGEHEVSLALYFFIGTNSLFFLLFSAASVVLKSVNKIKLLTLLFVFSALFIAPIMRIFSRMVGIDGLPIALTLVWFVMYLLTRMQTKKILGGKILLVKG